MDDLLSHSSNISGSVAPDNLWRDDSADQWQWLEKTSGYVNLLWLESSLLY